jgi:hypothetical protein
MKSDTPHHTAGINRQERNSPNLADPFNSFSEKQHLPFVGHRCSIEHTEKKHQEQWKKNARNTQQAKGKTKTNFREIRSVHQDSEDKSS